MNNIDQIAAEAWNQLGIDEVFDGDKGIAIIKAAIEKAYGTLLARLDMAERARDCAYKESDRYAELMRENKRLRAAQASEP